MTTEVGVDKPVCPMNLIERIESKIYLVMLWM